MNHKRLNQIFNKFAGREVKVIENVRTMNIGGKDYTFTNPRIAKDDKVTKEIAKEAKKHLFNRVRAWLPESAGTMDFDTSRLNYRIGKDSDGKYRVMKDSFGAG